MSDNNLLNEVESKLKDKFGSSFKINNSSPVTGGCINHGSKLETSHGDLFMKYNTEDFVGMFEAEAKGLRLLREPDVIHVPEVIMYGSLSDGKIFLVLEWIGHADSRDDFWESFGRGMARLHKNKAEQFGLDHDNFIGSLPQYNQKKDTWGEFFSSQRLEKQIQIALDGPGLPGDVVKRIRDLYPKIDEIFPKENPALIHGDLWSGNFLVNEKGAPSIIDPAVYYGHREMEIAFTKLFGGYHRKFYDSYNEEYPLEEGHKDRVDVCNIYPLMVHVNLFGESYLFQLQQLLKELRF